MFCHTCGFEYEEGITQCGKCNIDLVAEPLPRNSYVYKELVLLDSFTNVVEANLAKGTLESEGIDAYLFGDDMVAANWLLMNAIGGLRLMVGSGDENRAKEILQDYRAVKEASIREDTNVVTCPQCHSKKVKVHNPFWLPGLIFILVVKMPAFFNMQRMKCRECKFIWEKTLSD
jgi:hypothetical protein